MLACSIQRLSSKSDSLCSQYDKIHCWSLLVVAVKMKSVVHKPADTTRVILKHQCVIGVIKTIENCYYKTYKHTGWKCVYMLKLSAQSLSEHRSEKNIKKDFCMTPMCQSTSAKFETYFEYQ